MLGRFIGLLRRPRAGPVVLLLLHLAALGLFTRGFLLTRVHLAQRSAAATNGGTTAASAPYDRVVWLMIDALRYDFVVTDGRYRCNNATGAVCHQGHMPYLSDLARHPASRAFMFVADAPTTTTQRLKAMVTGGLPSFFDVSNSFTAGALADDNLVDQLAAAGRNPAFLGDTTWAQLFPTQWAWSAPYPCFNVRDLHTVDDGVWQHLLPALRPDEAAGSSGNGTGVGSWGGLLVAHYLGVDHCGHTYGVASSEMAAKLRQMDDHVRQVVAALVQLAGPGGPHERTLLLVSGDHGQTLGGDHGGGSPEEVDSALVAVDIKALRDAQQAQQAQQASGSTGAAAALAALAGPGGSGLGAPAACRADCSCGVERNQCAPDLPQMDLTPTLAALLGLPTPFGNLGKLSAELWQLAAPHLPAAAAGEAGSRDGLRAAWEDSLAAALLANVRQVHTYLHTYAATPGASFSRAALARLDELVAAAQAVAGSVAEHAARSYAYLEAAADVAREQWTQFGDASMVAGVALFAVALVLHAAAAFGPIVVGTSSGSSRAGGKRQTRAASRPNEGEGEPAGGNSTRTSRLAAVGQHVAAWQLAARWRTGSRVWVPTLRAWLAALALVHSLGIFSFFFLLSEGRNVSILVGAACAGLALAAGQAARAASKPIKGVVAMGVASLRFNALMTVLGVAHHTGQGFWARLTVHDPQPAGDVERGWHGSLAKLKALGAAGMAAVGLDRLPPAVLAVMQHSLLCTLPILALAALTERLQRGSARPGLHRLLVLAAFASAGAYLQLEDASKRGFLPEQVSLQQLMQHHALPALPTELAAPVEQALTATQQQLVSAWPAAAQLGTVLASLPLRELLPHATYALCGTAAALWLAALATGRLRGAAATTAAAQLVLAVLVQVSERGSPLILLLGLLQLAAMARLLARRAELLPPAGTAGVAGEAGVLVALVAAQLFYATGHMCEFAGLQYTAGFVGSDEFHLWRSGTLVALNTFGGLLLALLALPYIVEYVQAAGGSGASAMQRGRGAKAAAAGGSVLQRAVLVAGLVRAAPTFCAMLSAGVQRRHLYVWALFAPKFVFEACFLVLTDAVLLLVVALA
ncbi:GPI ethanolamine phosphate transferase 3 [Chlorella sorokiniana]|uniref:GPI ethanolamine phosphate transferase 3 n=1 Tax=Chlorella sorokiniana TaxID=3076 RepID=A0A2P6TTQ8_CHLSO|nr:GPI ethanolamine phosphate transferase 3 [Chlorella sorokiniana]|eukprot:PRW57424.1 GPI ethanolamine phosphate transferase 3 [Chlorella sorokiniana]